MERFGPVGNSLLMENVIPFFPLVSSTGLRPDGQRNGKHPNTTTLRGIGKNVPQGGGGGGGSVAEIYICLTCTRAVMTPSPYEWRINSAIMWSGVNSDEVVEPSTREQS